MSASVTQKPTLDPDEACSYRFISNLSYFSKCIKRVGVSRFAEHSSTYNLLPVQQSEPIDLFTQLKQLSCPSTTILSAPLTTAKYLFSSTST